MDGLTCKTVTWSILLPLYVFTFNSFYTYTVPNLNRSFILTNAVVLDIVSEPSRVVFIVLKIISDS